MAPSIMSPTYAPADRPSGRQVAFWVAIAVLVSNIDRGNLATAGPLIRSELQLTATQFGVLISCFYWSYTAFIWPATWLSGRVGAKIVLALCVGVWSFATGLLGLAVGFASLLMLRLLLGAGESGVFPCASAILAAEVAGAERGRANGLLAVAIAIGPAFGALAGGLLMDRLGWRWVFAGLGMISLAWLVPWIRVGIRQSRRAKLTSYAESVSLTSIIRQRALWGTTIGNVCGGYTYYFMISWMPTYLVQERGMSMSGMAELTGTAYLVRAVMSVVSGRVIDAWDKAGRPATLVYKMLTGTNQLAAVACLVGMVTASRSAFVIWIFVYEFFSGLGTTAGLALVQTLAGPRATGPWVGIQNLAASVAGIVAPVITGLLIDRTGHYLTAFAMAGTMALIGFVAWVIVVPRVAPISWGSASPRLDREIG